MEYVLVVVVLSLGVLFHALGQRSVRRSVERRAGDRMRRMAARGWYPAVEGRRALPPADASWRGPLPRSASVPGGEHVEVVDGVLAGRPFATGVLLRRGPGRVLQRYPWVSRPGAWHGADLVLRQARGSEEPTAGLGRWVVEGDDAGALDREAVADWLREQSGVVVLVRGGDALLVSDAPARERVPADLWTDSMLYRLGTMPIMPGTYEDHIEMVESMVGRLDGLLLAVSAPRA